jgi:succinate-acetate transporter protein
MLVENTDTARARIYLQPVAAPSILGLYGFAGATFMIAAYMAGWYGSADTLLYLAPFAAVFGGVAQFLAGMWAFRARDGLATAMHGMWGSFWIAFGLLMMLFRGAPGTFPPASFPALGYWFIVLAAITWMGAWGALAENVSLFLVLVFLAAGATLEAIFRLAGGGGVNIAAGYCLLISSFIAFYTASALMLAECYGHAVLGIGKTRKAAAEPPVIAGAGEPGVVRGQSLNLEPQVTTR